MSKKWMRIQKSIQYGRFCAGKEEKEYIIEKQNDFQRGNHLRKIVLFYKICRPERKTAGSMRSAPRQKSV